MCSYQGVRNVGFSENFAYVLSRWPLKQRDVKIKLSLTKHRIELLNGANTLITDNPGTKFLFASADVHGNMKIRLKDTRNEREVVVRCNN